MRKLTPEELSKVQKKLAKLMALSASPNEAEASVALSKCQELMDKYGISSIDVDPETNYVSTDSKFVAGHTRNMPKWNGMLVARIASIFNVVVITRKNDSGVWSGFTMVGGTSDVSIVVDLYTRLRRVVSQMGKTYVENQLTRTNSSCSKASYCTGMVLTISRRLDKLLRTQETGLVLVKKKEVDKHVADLFGGRLSEKKIKPALPKDITAMQAGIRDGEKVPLYNSLEKGTVNCIDSAVSL